MKIPVNVGSVGAANGGNAGAGCPKDSGGVVSVNSWELVTAVDGPGTRLTIFTSGCPLRCLYCHNPETRYAKWGKPWSHDEVWSLIERYRGVFEATGGGVTFSGGEVMMHIGFIDDMVARCRRAGVHVALDTTGYLGYRLSDETLSGVGLVLLDMKAGAVEHRRVTGRPVEPVLDFATRLSALGKRTWVRFVLVPGLTDGEENVAAVIRQAAGMGECVERFEILPFHTMGVEKWVKVGLPYQLGDTPPPSRESIEWVRAQAEAAGLPVFVG